MRELELREKKVNDIQALGDKLVREGHPGKKTVEVRALIQVCARRHNSPFFNDVQLIDLTSPTRRLSQLLCRLSGAGSCNSAAASRLISRKTQPTIRYSRRTSDVAVQQIHTERSVIRFLKFFPLQFFADVKDAQDKMKKMQENMKKKYSCDRTTTATRLEDLLQDAVVSHCSSDSRTPTPTCKFDRLNRILFSFHITQKQEEREQLNEFKTVVAGLNKRAKSIIQLKPRNPTTQLRGKLPIQAVCDFKQQEVRRIY